MPVRLAAIMDTSENAVAAVRAALALEDQAREATMAPQTRRIDAGGIVIVLNPSQPQRTIDAPAAIELQPQRER